MVYNAYIEEKIYELIEESFQEGLPEGSKFLNQALIILNKEFGAPHSLDLPKEDIERIKIRRKTYEKIIKVYNRLINDFIGTNYETLLNEKNKLESKLSELENRGNGLESNLEDIKKKNEDLEEANE
jgi:DNA repair exonuclease SbcCD ATPase subunit